MADKRTSAQWDFDFALHGISFAHREMQLGMLKRAEIAWEKLGPLQDIKREERLMFWRKQLEQ